MATKVGGFTKSGVVQCVKLVEEPAKINTNAFSGTYSGSTVVLNNGMEISLVGRDFISGDRLYFVHDPNYSTIIFDLLVESNGIVTLDLVAGDQEFTKTDNIYFTRIVLETDPMTGSVPSEIIFSSTASTIHYSYEVQISSSKFGFASDSMYVLTPAARLKNPTVRMGKDGTLKCKELIEEATTINVTGFNGIYTGSPRYILFNNGYSLQALNSSNEVVEFPSVAQLSISVRTGENSSSTSSAIVPFVQSTIYNDANWVASSIGADTNWFANFVKIGQIILNSATGLLNSYKLKFISPSDEEVILPYITSASSTRSVFLITHESIPSVEITYKARINQPTVRVYKDGTIRCAGVEEATLTPKIGNGDWFEMTRSSASSGTFNFYGGQWTMTVEGPNGGSPTLFQTVSTIYAQVPLLPSGQPDNTIQWVGSPPYTTYYPSIYDESNYNRDGAININRIVVISTTSMERYKITINNGQNTAVYGWHLFTGTSNAFEPVNEQQWELTESDRFTYSWPGSTIIKATNTFITSDNKNFLTNTGDQFMVR